MSGRRGTVARPQAVGWRSGAAGLKKLRYTRLSSEDPKQGDDYLSVYIYRVRKDICAGAYLLT